MGIHSAILNKLIADFTRGMMTDISDQTKAGVVMIGPCREILLQTLLAFPCRCSPMTRMPSWGTSPLV